MGRLESSVTRLEVTVAIAALTCCPKHGFDVALLSMPAFFRLALTSVAEKSVLPNFPHGPLAWIIHEDSASRGNLAKQVGQSSEKRGSPRAEKDRPRCDARFSSGVE